MDRKVVYTAPRGLAFTRTGLREILDDLDHMTGSQHGCPIVEIVPTVVNQKVGKIKRVTQTGSL
jgi:hypothetical protein